MLTDLGPGLSEPAANTSTDRSRRAENGGDESREGRPVTAATLYARQRRHLAGGGGIGSLAEFRQTTTLGFWPGIAGVAGGVGRVGACLKNTPLKLVLTT